MDLITEVVNARLPINTKCKVKIAMIEQKRIALKRKITMAMVTDFKVKEIDERTAERVRRSLDPRRSFNVNSIIAAIFINTIAGGDILKSNQAVYFFNRVNDKIVDVQGMEFLTEDYYTVKDELVMDNEDREEYYQPFVNRYMRNFMEEIK